jgi:hypothetical protein
MSNHITIELCAEDRARIDRLTKALEALQPPTVHMDMGTKPDPVLEALKTQVAPTESPAEPAGAAEAETPATPQPEAEQAATAEPAPAAEAKPAPTTQELQQKVIALVNKGKKADVSAIVKSYAATVSGIPEDKRAECMDKLNALEG